MANQIRFKRASGSDPTASDLVLGEPAVRTDTGELFFKKDNGSVAKVSGGGISDGDKGDISVSNSGATFTIDSGVIDNANIASNAAIAGSKISPDFGSQNITTTGTIGSNNITITDGGPKISFVDTNNNDDFDIKVNSGSFKIVDATDDNDRFAIDSSGNITATGTFTTGSHVITGNITVSGTVDGRDVASDGSKLDGIEAGATADQSASEILTLLKTVDGAGSGLDADTLDGISSASFVRSDADDTLNGQYTISDSADEKLKLSGSNSPYIRFQEGTTNKAYIRWNAGGYIELVNQETAEALRIENGVHGLKFIEGGNTRTVFHTGNLAEGDGGLTTNNFTDADHSKLNGIEAGATADQTASEILTLIKTVDGAGSGLDADTLDGATSSFFQNASNLSSGTVPQARLSASTLLTLIKTVDGSGSGLDADTLDGISSASFVRSDASDNLSGLYTFNSTSNDIINFTGSASSDNRGISFNSRTALSADQNDGYLRLNNAGEFGNGVYTPGVIRADNGFQVDGTTVINGSAQLIASRLTGSLPAIDGSSLTGISAGATGGGSDEVFYENDQTVTSNYTITNGKNAMAAGPITINSGVTVTVGSGETLTIV
jgi:hypothetical protein